MGIKEYESKIGYGEDGLKTILEENLSKLTLSYEESYILDRTRAYHNLLQNKTGKRGSQAIQSYVWDFNVDIWKKGKKSLHIYRMNLEVQFAFLSMEEKIKLYMDMVSLERIPMAYSDMFSHSDIQDTDMIR